MNALFQYGLSISVGLLTLNDVTAHTYVGLDQPRNGTSSYPRAIPGDASTVVGYASIGTAETFPVHKLLHLFDLFDFRNSHWELKRDLNAG